MHLSQRSWTPSRGLAPTRRRRRCRPRTPLSQVHAIVRRLHHVPRARSEGPGDQAARPRSEGSEAQEQEALDLGRPGRGRDHDAAQSDEGAHRVDEGPPGQRHRAPRR